MDGRLRIGACLSLSGRFAQFGRQAALGLKVWQTLAGPADLVIEDDRSDRRALEAILPDVAARCDILLGPYSTLLMRAAGRLADDADWLVWNHGGSGDDVQQAHPGHVVSVLTPTSRYAEPFLRHLAAGSGQPRPLVIVSGPGSFGRQVTDGAAKTAVQLGLHPVRAEVGDQLPSAAAPGGWDLFSAGVFEQDAELVSKALSLPDPPRRVCAIAAGVREFARAVGNPEGVFGIAQWFPGAGHEAATGPGEDDFLRAYAAAGGGLPDYPAVQAAAGAALAVHCAGLAGSTGQGDLWAAASGLDTSTLFGAFRIGRDGTQTGHQTALVRWSDGHLGPVGVPRHGPPTLADVREDA